MTLIASFINKAGIVIASDSNLSNDQGNSGFGQKVFPVIHINSGLAYSGSYTINNEKIDKWMPDFINRAAANQQTIEEFTILLSETLTREIRDYEWPNPIIIHICGYQTYDHQSYIEHWHVSNAGLNEADGTYGGMQSNFHFGNDFNTRLIPDHLKALQILEESPMEYHLYINGFPDARIAAVYILNMFKEVFKQIWSLGAWKYHPPENLFEFSTIIKLCLNVLCELFKISNYNALYIGGEIQTYLIPKPPNLATPAIIP